MTKKDLEEMTKYTPRNQEEAMFIEAIIQFLDSNVCIPKGTEVKIPIWNNGYAVCKVENLVIKPSELVYEWQWNGILFDTPCTVYATEDEMVVNTFKSIQFKSFVKIEETKRVRQ